LRLIQRQSQEPISAKNSSRHTTVLGSAWNALLGMSPTTAFPPHILVENGIIAGGGAATNSSSGAATAADGGTVAASADNGAAVAAADNGAAVAAADNGAAVAAADNGAAVAAAAAVAATTTAAAAAAAAAAIAADNSDFSEDEVGTDPEVEVEVEGRMKRVVKRWRVQNSMGKVIPPDSARWLRCVARNKHGVLSADAAEWRDRYSRNNRVVNYLFSGSEGIAAAARQHTIELEQAAEEKRLEAAAEARAKTKEFLKKTKTMLKNQHLGSRNVGTVHRLCAEPKFLFFPSSEVGRFPNPFLRVAAPVALAPRAALADVDDSFLDDPWNGEGTPHPTVPDVNVAGTARVETLLLNDLYENLLDDYVNFFVAEGVAALKKGGQRPYFAVTMGEEAEREDGGEGEELPGVLPGVKPVAVVLKWMARSLALLNPDHVGATLFNHVVREEAEVHHPDDYDKNNTKVTSRVQHLYLVVSNRMSAVKAGVTGISEFELCERYTSHLGKVDQHAYIPIKNGMYVLCFWLHFCPHTHVFCLIVCCVTTFI